MGYKSTQQQEWEDSPLFSVMKYRKPETLAEEDVLDEFVYFLDSDDFPIRDKKHLQSLIQSYLEYDLDKVKAGEQELYQQWIKASKGE